jgi:hypothetical protein
MLSAGRLVLGQFLLQCSGARKGNINALKHGHYTRLAIAERQSLQSLLRVSRELIAKIR